MKVLKIEVSKMLADIATLTIRERGEYIGEVLRQARTEQDVTYDWVGKQIELSKTRAAAGAKGGARPKQEAVDKPKRTVTRAPKPQKKMYGNDVMLLETEYAALVSKYGESIAKRSIEILVSYKQYKLSKGEPVVYKSDYAAINKWVADKAIQEEEKKRYEQSKAIRVETRQSPEEFAPLEL